MLDLDAIEARTNAATPGRWRVQHGPAVVSDQPDDDLWPVCAPHGYHDVADAFFIAHARQDIPALVAEVRRLRGTLEFYADEKRWNYDSWGDSPPYSEADRDGGAIARAALGQEN